MFYVHGNNLNQKLTLSRKYRDVKSIELLNEILPKYEKWKDENLKLLGPFVEPKENDRNIITQRVKLFEDYKEFIDKQVYAEAFDSRSNLHSSVIEEFLYFLFKDLVEKLSINALIGKSHTFKDIFFMPTNYSEMLVKTNAKIEIKDHDFVIGSRAVMKIKTEGSTEEETIEFELPAVAIECKTYLDKTMLEGSSTAAEQLKVRNPNGFYIVVAEWLKLTENINLRKYKVDQIYILRKQKNTDREYRYLPGYVKNPIYSDVVEHLYTNVRSHLTSDWTGGVKDVLTKGYID